MHHVLFTLKSARPDQFREELRVTPHTFDVLVTKLHHDIVFWNNSRCPQMPVEEQLAITLFRFGHDGQCCEPSGSRKLGSCWKGNCTTSDTSGHDCNPSARIHERSSALSGCGREGSREEMGSSTFM
jgi:hypothetical protein